MKHAPNYRPGIYVLYIVRCKKGTFDPHQAHSLQPYKTSLACRSPGNVLHSQLKPGFPNRSTWLRFFSKRTPAASLTRSHTGRNRRRRRSHGSSPSDRLGGSTRAVTFRREPPCMRLEPFSKSAANHAAMWS